MGTRHLVCVILDGGFKVAQYGQWDGYPEGQGIVVHQFLKKLVEDGGLDSFKDKTRKLKALTPEEVNARWVECGASPGESFVSMTVADEVKRRYPQFQRDLSAGVLQAIADGDVTEVDLQTEFATDGLFCEWCYVIDLDEGILEVHKGGRCEEEREGRFAHLESTSDHPNYGPVREVARFPFDRLPDEDTFVRICDGEVLDRLANIPDN